MNTSNIEQANTSVLNKILRSKNTKTAESLALGFMVAQAAWGMFKQIRQKGVERKTVALRFEEGTDEYAWLCRWLAKQPRIETESSGRAFSVKHLGLNSASRLPGQEEEVQSSKERADWALIPDKLNGFRFENLVIGISREEPKQDGSNTLLTRTVVLTCVTRNMPAIDRLLASIHDAGHESDGRIRTPSVMALDKWGDWKAIRKAPSNRIPVLPKGILESLKSDFEWFSKNDSWYYSVGVPYRRGYLFHGIPGSGKTTTAISLAASFNRDIYVLPIDELSDEKMMQAIRQAGRDGVIVIEDIDCASVTNERGEQNKTTKKDSPTLMGLLNAIDGAAAPEGRILIATTNRREVLDKALIRPGRFDREFEFTHADYHQIAELCRRFGLGARSEEMAERWHSDKISMASVQQRLIEICGIG